MLETAKNPHIKTINMQARVFACDCSLATWSKIRRCAGSPKDTPDNVVASCVFYSIRMLRSLGPDSEHWCPVQVEMIVHSKQLCHFRRRTLLGWLDESVHPQVEPLEAELIHPGRRVDPPWTQGWYGFRTCITQMHGMLDVDQMHLAPAVAWPTSSASICRDFPFGRSDMQPTIWPQSGIC